MEFEECAKTAGFCSAGHLCNRTDGCGIRD